MTADRVEAALNVWFSNRNWRLLESPHYQELMSRALAAADALAPSPELEGDIAQPWPSPMLLELGECLYKEWVHSDPTPGDKEWLELDDAEREMYCHFVKRIVDKFLALTKRPALAPPPAVLTADRIKEMSREQLTSERDEARREVNRLMGLMRAAPPPPAGLRRVRHVRRGTIYTVLGEAMMQVSTMLERRLYEGDLLVVYQGEDGRLWMRSHDEFNDGRFEPVP